MKAFVFTLIAVVTLVAIGCNKTNNDTSPTNQYTYVNGYCYNSSNQIVPNSYCTSTTGGQCMGYYTYNNYGYYQTVYCSNSYGYNNCRGLTLIDQQGRQVTCQ